MLLFVDALQLVYGLTLVALGVCLLIWIIKH